MEQGKLRGPIRRIAGIIELLMNYHPRGFDVLLGICEPPTDEEVHEMLDMLRTKTDESIKTRSNYVNNAERIMWDAETFNNIIEEAGGWARINKICNECRRLAPRYWEIVINHIKYIGTMRVHHTSRLGMLAARYACSVRTVQRYRREFPERLAEFLLNPDVDMENFAQNF